jgi:hypothetical protein
VSNFKYTYTGKPSSKQTIGTGYTKITDARFKAPGKGYMLTMLYVNCAIKYGSTATGGLRARMVRESPTDETAYQDYSVTKNGVTDNSFLITHVWFGAADKDRYYNWQLRRSSSLSKVEGTTRYSKWLWVSTEQFARMVGFTGSEEDAIKLLTALLEQSEGGAVEFEL